MKSRLIKSVMVVFLFFPVVSCLEPASTADYLDRFEQFVKDVEKNGSKFNESDWKWANKRYSKYTGVYYDRFREDLKMEEKIRVTVLKGRYLAAKGSSSEGRLIQENLKENVDKLGQDVQKYLDENLDEDIEEITKGAREIGDSAVKVVEEVLRELKKKKE